LRIRDILEVKDTYEMRIFKISSFLIILFYIIGIFTPWFETISQLLVVISSLFLIYGVFIPYKIFTGEIRKIYLPIFISVIVLFFIEVNYTFFFLMNIPSIYSAIFLLLPALISVSSAYIAAYYIFDFWIRPLLGSRKIFFGIGFVSIAIISGLMFILGITYGITIFDTLLAVIEFPLFIIVLYEYQYFKDGILSKSWIFILSMTGLILLGDLIRIFTYVLGFNSFISFIRSLYIIGYLLGSYGFLIHKF